MEQFLCEHHRNMNNDKNIFLDDENALVLTNEDCKTCVVCCKQATRNVNLTPVPLFNIDEIHWRERSNASLLNQIFSNNPIVSCAESRLSINSSDSIDAPLLLNERYEFDGVEEFHCHFYTKHKSDNLALKKLLAASLMCLFFMVTEIVGGYLANSLSVMTDAAHLMSDFIGFLVSLFSIWIGQKKRTKRMSFGFHRAEVLGALFSIVVVWMLTGIFIYLALFRLIHGKYEIDANTMMIVAAIGVFINIVMGLILHGGCISLSHSHSHSGTASHGHSHANSDTSGNNINVRAAVIHVLGDLIQSVGVLCAALIIKFYPAAKIADPICTFFFSIIVIFTTKNVLRDTITVLMEGFPSSVDYNSVQAELTAIEGVRHVHGLHIWSLTLNKNALAVHLAVDKFCDKEEVLQQATCLVKYKYSISNVTIQIEKYKADVISSCKECQLPTD